MPTPLANLLRNHIAAHGPVTVEEFMAQALYHPQYGYYTNGHNFLPAPLTPFDAPYPHDFTTAPELTPLFGATLANWTEKQWHLHGRPTPFTLMECGPGRGILMHDLLIHLQATHPACYAAAQPVLVETSPTLTSLQQQTLQALPQIQWTSSPTTLQSGNPIILVANELLDAFPTHQYVLRNGAWHQRLITLTNSLAFTFTEAPQPTEASILPPANLPEGTITELAPLQAAWLATLPETLIAALFADYGAETTTATGDTLQAIHRHQKTDIFHKIGQTDLTTHVNFTATAHALTTTHRATFTTTTEDLAPFLLRHGLASLALANGPHTSPDTTLQRLLHPAQMGTLFKVQCYSRTRP